MQKQCQLTVSITKEKYQQFLKEPIFLVGDLQELNIHDEVNVVVHAWYKNKFTKHRHIVDVIGKYETAVNYMTLNNMKRTVFSCNTKAEFYKSLKGLSKIENTLPSNIRPDTILKLYEVAIRSYNLKEL